MKKTAVELLNFCKGHWHVPLAIPFMLIFFTVLHETAHAAAVILQGGKVTEFVFLPGEGKWGHIRYVFDSPQPYSAFSISMAPYYMWFGICVLSLLLSLRKKSLSYWIAGLVFTWMYVAPAADIANTAIGWLYGSQNDFTHALGNPSQFDIYLMAAAAVVFMVIGYFLQTGLYRDRALAPAAYSVLCILISALLVSVTGIGLADLFPSA